MSCSLIKLLGSQFRRNEDGGEAETKCSPVILSTKQLSQTPTTVIGLYFANMQSSKSKEFTKVLIKFYEQMKKSSVSLSSSLSSSSSTSPTSSSSFTTNFILSSFEVIMISFDEIEKIVYLTQTQTPFLHFVGDGSRIRQEYLIRKYGVHETPTLILMDCTSGHVINFHGREKMVEDPNGIQFPWRYSSCTDILGSSHLITSSPSTDNLHSLSKSDTLKESVKGLLFAAYWYPPCRTFISSLIEVYNKVRERGKKFEIIFVSSDRSKESFERFFSKMPWLGISYEDEKVRTDLTTLLNIKSIPTLIVMDSEDNVITGDGRVEVNDDLEGYDFPWYPKLVDELRDRHSSILNSSLSLIYFIGDDDAEYDKAEGVLLPIATQITTNSEVEEPFQTKFFIGTDSELSESLRLFIDLEEKSFILILDIPNFRYALLLSEQEIDDEKSVKDFLHKFQTSQLEYKYIQNRFI